MPGTSTEQVVDKGIRQKSTKEWTHSLTAVPFVRGAPKRVPSDSEKHRRVYTSSNVCHSHEWCVDTASGKTLKKRNACLHAVRQAVGKKIACIYGLRSEGVKVSVSKSGCSVLLNWVLGYEYKWQVPWLWVQVTSSLALSTSDKFLGFEYKWTILDSDYNKMSSWLWLQVRQIVGCDFKKMGSWRWVQVNEFLAVTTSKWAIACDFEGKYEFLKCVAVSVDTSLKLSQAHSLACNWKYENAKHNYPIWVQHGVVLNFTTE